MDSKTLALAEALRKGTLRVEAEISRFGGTFLKTLDDRGLIEVFDTEFELQERLTAVRTRFGL